MVRIRRMKAHANNPEYLEGFMVVTPQLKWNIIFGITWKEDYIHAKNSTITDIYHQSYANRKDRVKWLTDEQKKKQDNSHSGCGDEHVSAEIYGILTKYKMVKSNT